MVDRERIEKYIQPLSPIPTNCQPGGELDSQIKCLLFDIYGTLFISGSGDIGSSREPSSQSRQLTRLLSQYQIDKSPQILLAEYYAAIQKQHAVSKAAGIDFPEVVIDKIWRRVIGYLDQVDIRQFAIEFELIVNPVYPMPHLKETLSACKKRGLTMGIISNAQFYTPYLFSWFLNADLQALGFEPELTLLSYQLGHAKPSPYLFDQAAQILNRRGIPNSSVTYIGNDMLNDIYPSHSVGFKTVLFAGDARSLRLREDDVRCRDIAADVIVTDLEQLLAVIPPIFP